jgi:hypothetical protein
MTTRYCTYDDWKTASPDDDEPTGECDCCGKRRLLTRCWARAIETHACDECRGEVDDD